MFVIQLPLLLLLLTVTSVVPGLLIVRWWRWRLLETLCAALIGSQFVIYLLGWSFYVFGVRWGWSYLFSLACLAVAWPLRGDLRMFWKRRDTRRAILVVAGLFVWMMLCQGMIRVYSPVHWSGDWYEHYERAIFLIDHVDPHTPILENYYTLTARPPLMNAVTGFYIAQVGRAFWINQAIFCFLSVLPVVPAALMLPRLFPKARRPVWLLGLLLALNPLFVQNVTWPWTKLGTVTCVIFGIWLYLEAWRRRDMLRMVVAFAVLAVGALVHYSTGPYLVFLAAHYMLWLWYRRPRPLMELAAIVSCGTLILATWFGWAVATFGVRDTLARNTTVEGLTGGDDALYPLKVIALNIDSTLVPFPLRGHGWPNIPECTSYWAHLRNSAFYIYQTHLLFAIGSLSALAVLWLLAKIYCRPSPSQQARRALVALIVITIGLIATQAILQIRGTFAAPLPLWLLTLPLWLAGYLCWWRAKPLRRESLFWLWLIGVATLLGIATHGEALIHGVGHICAQPTLVLGVSLLAAGFRQLPLGWRAACLVGLWLDFLLGILLNLVLQSRTLRLWGNFMREIHFDNSSGLGTQIWTNQIHKQRQQVVQLGDTLAQWHPLLIALLVGLALGGLAWATKTYLPTIWARGRTLLAAFTENKQSDAL